MKFLSKDLSVKLVDDKGDVVWEAYHGGSQVYEINKDGIEFGYNPDTDVGWVRNERDHKGIPQVVDDFQRADHTPIGRSWSGGSGIWAEGVAARRLPEPGLCDDEAVLVCDSQIEVGDAMRKCSECESPVGIPRRYIDLWGKKDRRPPAVVCRECRAKKVPEEPTFSLWTGPPTTSRPLEDMERALKKIREETNLYARKYVASVESFRAIAEDAATLSRRITTCQRCGQSVDDGSGRKVCRDCTRRQWRGR